MSSESMTQEFRSLTQDERRHLRHIIKEASEPIAQFWPMKTFIHHNPIHGLEHLPFDQAIREAKHLLGGKGTCPMKTIDNCIVRDASQKKG